MKTAMLSGALILSLGNVAAAEIITHRSCDFQIMKIDTVNEVLGQENVATLIGGLNAKGYSYVDSPDDSALTLIIDNDENVVEIRGHDDLSDSQSDADIIVTELTMDDLLGGKVRYSTNYDAGASFSDAIQKFLAEVPRCVKNK